MQCCNKNLCTFGIIIGSIYILGSLIVFSLSIFSFLENSDVDIERRQAFPSEVIVISLVTAIISVLFVWAIVKKHHSLILPWLLFCVADILASCLFIFILFLAAGWTNAPDEALFIILLIGACVIGVEIAIFWFSCCLYREIRKNNMENFTKPPAVNYENETTNYTSMSEKTEV